MVRIFAGNATYLLHDLKPDTLIGFVYEIKLRFEAGYHRFLISFLIHFHVSYETYIQHNMLHMWLISRDKCKQVKIITYSFWHDTSLAGMCYLMIESSRVTDDISRMWVSCTTYIPDALGTYRALISNLYYVFRFINRTLSVDLCYFTTGYTL